MIYTTEGRGRLYGSILETVGNTPAIRLNLMPAHVTMYVKAEAFNPGGSVKDRLAVNIIEEAERNGTLEARTDRGGGHQRQHRNRSCDGMRGQGLSAGGDHDARQVLGRTTETDALPGRQGGAHAARSTRRLRHVDKAKELAEANGWFLARQFETQANADIHESTTGREIMGDFEGQRLDHLVMGYGTGGTVAGVGRVLRAQRPEVKIILSEPANAQILGGGHAQKRNEAHEPVESHPDFEPHPIQGWTPDFIPWVLQEALDRSYFDELIPVSGAGRHRMVAQAGDARRYLHRRLRWRLLRRRHAGCAAGTGRLGAAEGARSYLSTPLFEDIRRIWMRGRAVAGR